MPDVTLKQVDLPDFGLPSTMPSVPAETYQARVEAARQRARDEGFDVLVVYGDREHLATLAYLTGYDPRFEEALLVLPTTDGAKPTLMVGVEGWVYADISPLDLNKVLYATFSLLGMPREDQTPLSQLLRDAGIHEGMRVGAAGWKYFDARETSTPDTWLEIPAFLVDTLRSITGERTRVINATRLFMNPADGLRCILDVDQLAVLEFAETHSSQAMRNMLFGIKPGMTELALAQMMNLNGLPVVAHPMLSTGDRTRFGLASPSMKVIEYGDPVMMAFGYQGALNARAGFLVGSAQELPELIRDYVEKLVGPYFTAIVEWYQNIGIGVKGGTLYERVHNHIGDPFFGVKFPPGHLIHLDEWVHSPIFEGSAIALQSGMAVQADVIPATGTPYFTTNIEDGIALADEKLRSEFARKYPEAYARIHRRRRFMETVLGIKLKPEVLPFSNIPAYLAPFLLNPTQVMVNTG